MATPEDRSLMSGIAIPQWMKNKRNSKFDLDPSTFSPTELDDSFMLYYRHPSSAAALNNSETKILTSNLPEKIIVAKVTNKIADFSQHPGPCQKYLQKTADVSAPPQTTAQMKIKSAGTDDGFKGEAAQCASSIVRVATQMVSAKVINGYGAKEDASEGEKIDAFGAQYDASKRRGSKSLPASPLTSPRTSPRSNRKAVNKYFTGAFTDSDKPRGGWILSNLLARRDISQSVDLIEETKEELDRDRAASTASVDEISTAVKKSPVFKAKPSELREMNFWSPTSM